MNDMGARFSLGRVTPKFPRRYAHVRVFQNDTTTTTTTPSTLPVDTVPSQPQLPFNGGGSIGMRSAAATRSFWSNAVANVGDQGDRVGGDVMVERLVDGR